MEIEIEEEKAVNSRPMNQAGQTDTDLSRNTFSH